MERILEDLARHIDDATRPDVDLYLASGPVLRGRVMKVQQGLATVHLGPATDPSVSYVRVEQIVAVTVLASGRSAYAAPGATPSVEGPRSPSHHDDIITPVNEMTFAAMQAAMATPTPPEELAVDRASRRSSDDVRRTSSAGDASRLEKARAGKARAEASRAELAAAEAARGDVARGDSARHERVDVVRGEISRNDRDSARGDSARNRADVRRSDDVSAAFSAMRVETGAIPASDPIAEFVASQYDVITPPDPIVPVSLELPAQSPMDIEAPTYLGERPQSRAKPQEPVAPTFIGDRPQPRGQTPAPLSAAALAASAPASAGVEATFPMRGETPKPKAARSPAPSRPELMRQAGVHAEMMSRVLRHRVEIAIGAPLDDDARRAIGHALPVASDVLLAMFGEPTYRGALERVVSVELVAGDAEIMLDNARLVIRCSLVDRWTPATLRSAIEIATA
ncbi:MAG: hypothetical protein ACKV2T_12190 [Kofleriaceae bacterium]